MSFKSFSLAVIFIIKLHKLLRFSSGCFLCCYSASIYPVSTFNRFLNENRV